MWPLDDERPLEPYRVTADDVTCGDRSLGVIDCRIMATDAMDALYKCMAELGIPTTEYPRWQFVNGHVGPAVDGVEDDSNG